MTIRLVVADVDGTLVEPGRRVGEHAGEAVRVARERGAEFTIATGRVFSSAAVVARELGIAAPIIAGGGSVVAYPCGEPVSRLVLGRDAALDILRLASAWRGRGLAARYAFTGDRIFTDVPGAHVETYSTALGVPVAVVEDLAAAVNDETTQVVLRVDPAVAPGIVERLAPEVRGSARVMRTLPHLVEFTHPCASKGRALETVCSHLGIPTVTTLAIGDGESDTDMLAVAGAGAVVANAPAWVKRRCRYVTRGSYSAGVLEAVRDLVCAAECKQAGQVGGVLVKK